MLNNLFKKKDREEEKEEIIRAIVESIVNSEYEFNPNEQTEILNRVTVRIFERKKETRSELIRKARELQNSLVDIKIN